jgi:hypothetical protein
MGNICRSPTAQGVFEQLVTSQGLSDKIRIDSAGTHAYHIGEKPDARASRNWGLGGGGYSLFLWTWFAGNQAHPGADPQYADFAKR